MPGLKMGLPKFYLHEICITKIASPRNTLQRQPLQTRRKIPKETHYHTPVLLKIAPGTSLGAAILM